MDSDKAKDGNRRRWCMLVHSELEKRTLTQRTTKKGYENLKEDKDNSERSLMLHGCCKEDRQGLEVDLLLIKRYKLTFFVILKKYPNWLLDSNFIDFPASRPKSLAACIQKEPII